MARKRRLRRKAPRSESERKTIICKGASLLLTEVLDQKLRFLNYVKECDLDPTLLKVAHYVAWVALREIATKLSALGHSKFSSELLDLRNRPILPGEMLPLLDYIGHGLHKGYGLSCPDPNEIGSFPSLAEIRAHWLVVCVCDGAGKRILTEADIPMLLQKSPAALDRLYVAAARLNQIPLPSFDALLATSAESISPPERATEFTTADSKPATTTDQHVAIAKNETEQFVFAPAGGVYFISGLGESGHVPILEGFKILDRLVRCPGTPVLMAELEGTDTDDRMKADKRSKQPALDTPYFRQVYEELAELRRDLEQANQDGNVAEAERLQSKIEATSESLSASMGKRGGKSRARDLNNPLDQARSRIHRNLKTAREKLKESKPPMEKLAEHFKQSISSEGAAFVYHPGFPVKWHSTLPDPTRKQRM